MDKKEIKKFLEQKISEKSNPNIDIEKFKKFEAYISNQKKEFQNFIQDLNEQTKKLFDIQVFALKEEAFVYLDSKMNNKPFCEQNITLIEIIDQLEKTKFSIRIYLNDPENNILYIKQNDNNSEETFKNKDEFFKYIIDYCAKLIISFQTFQTHKNINSHKI